jgi:predicted nucleotidyltransferase component of viral defense system
MTYATPLALRAALEDRLRNRSADTGISLDRLRRRVLFERVVGRLEVADPGRWVLKGGMALEVRLHDNARLTKDIDIGLRIEVADADEVHERVVAALGVDRDGDGFEFATSSPQVLGADGAGHVTWRLKVGSSLAGKPFGGIQLDISPRAHELLATERMMLHSLLDFAGFPATEIEVVDVNRHAAEKLHAIARDYGERENTRVRDLVDVMLLLEHELLTVVLVAESARLVWSERDGTDPPFALPALPESWPTRYELLAAEHHVDPPTFPAAEGVIVQLWDEMFRPEEN